MADIATAIGAFRWAVLHRDESRISPREWPMLISQGVMIGEDHYSCSAMNVDEPIVVQVIRNIHTTRDGESIPVSTEAIKAFLGLN